MFYEGKCNHNLDWHKAQSIQTFIYTLIVKKKIRNSNYVNLNPSLHQVRPVEIIIWLKCFVYPINIMVRCQKDILLWNIYEPYSRFWVLAEFCLYILTNMLTTFCSSKYTGASKLDRMNQWWKIATMSQHQAEKTRTYNFHMRWNCVRKNNNSMGHS